MVLLSEKKMASSHFDGLFCFFYKMNTSVAPGVALPHGYYPGTGGVTGAIGISRPVIF
jgi:hypothetical protein